MKLHLRMSFILCCSLLIAVSGMGKNRIKVACVGNSVTFGYGLSNREQTCYPAVLQRKLGANYEVRNFGHSGTTLLTQGHRPYIQQTEYKEALAFKPDWVVIHLGLNDTDPRNWPNYNSAFDADYQQLINSFRKVNPNVKLWICLMTPIFHTHPRFESGTRDWHAAIQKHIRRIAKANQVGLIDLHTPLYSRPDLFADALHPNTEGAEIMAQTIYSATTGDYGGLKMSPLYADEMVMQRQQPIVFRGTANAKERVEVNFNGQRLSAVTHANGQWNVSFPAMDAGGPYEARITTKRGRLTIHHIYIGEVWLCSGQSNMEYPVKATTTAAEDEQLAAHQPLLHLYNMPTRFPTNAEKWSKAVLDSVNKLALLGGQTWQRASKETVSRFSSVAYHFGKALADSLKVPVGIICNAVGGTTTESWIDRHTLEWQFPSILHDWYHGDFGQPWARKRALENIANAENIALQRHPYTPCYMFEAGILPLKDYAIRGVAWYQGESNAHNIELHARLFRLLEKSWRRFFHQPKMPFLIVQLSSLNRPSWPEFRNSQRLLAAQQPQTWLTVTSDVGDSLDVHYRNKQPVGKRLALQALHHVYEHAIVSEGPSCIKARAVGELVYLYFENAQRLQTKEGPLTGFEVAGEDGVYHAAKAEIDGESVIVSCAEVPHPQTVRYGWHPFSRANLVNEALLPCSTFKKKIPK